MWWMIGICFVVVLIAVLTTGPAMPDWARESCTLCKAPKMKWKKGHDAGSTGEAMFQCENCGHREHRGGWGSELAMEHWEART